MFTISKKYLCTAALLVLVLATAITSCKDDDEAKQTYNFLEAFGPCPVARGGELTFIGADLSSVKSVEFPGGESVTPVFQGNGKFTVTVPESAQPGFLILHTTSGDITTVSKIGFSEPVTISGFTPEAQRPGGEVTISGKYLSNATEIVIGQVKIPLFPDNDAQQTIYDKYVKSVTNEAITFVVPADAITAELSLTDGQAAKCGTLTVTTPKFTSWSKSDGILPGTDEITMSGSDLDLINKITFANGTELKGADLKLAATKATFTLPLAAGDGAVTMTTVSGIEVAAGNIATAKPTVATFGAVNGNATPYCDEMFYIKGTNLQLVKSIIFAFNEGKEHETSTFSTANADEIQLLIPELVGSSMKWDDALNANIPTGSLYVVTHSGEKIKVSTDDNKLAIGWANIGTPASYSITAGELVTMTGCTNTAYMTQVEADGIQVDFTKIGKDSYSFVWPITSSGNKKILAVTYTNGDVNSNQYTPQTQFTVATATLPYVLVAPTDKISQGGTIILQGGNFEKITKIMCGDSELPDFTASADGKKLYIEVPTTFKACVAALDLIIDDTHKGQTPVLTIGDPEVVLWEGPWDKTSAWNGFEGLSWGNIPAAFKNIHVGDEFRIYATNNGGWIQCGFRLADGWKDKYPDGTDCQHQQDQLSADGYFSWIVTQQMYDEWKVNSNGIIIYLNGDNYVMNKITYIAK
ncbi:MAG: hypothetical protein IJ894_05765 [Bacteroidales bacterium]|nr:hypothetical protein [Bacteroidales bacterium]